MMSSRIAVAVLAGSFFVPAALANEHATYRFIENHAGALQPCRAGILLNLPASWQAGDGAVTLLTTEQTHDPAHDALVAALLHEHVAVLELVPVRCDGALATQDGVIAGALDALDAMTRTMGTTMMVAIGYGPGGREILDVVRAPAAGLLGANAPHYAAAVAIGDGAAAFALGEARRVEPEAPPCLAALCQALAAVKGGMGATPDRAAPAAASDACMAVMARETLPLATSLPATARR